MKRLQELSEHHGITADLIRESISMILTKYQDVNLDIEREPYMKTTVYLDPWVKEKLEKLAKAIGTSEAQLIDEALFDLIVSLSKGDDRDEKT